MNKLTASDLVAFINELDKNVSYNYLTTENKKIEILEVQMPVGPIKITRWDTRKEKIKNKVETISSKMILEIATALNPNQPINFDVILRGGGNTRSVFEALLAYTPEFYFGYLDGHKQLVWVPNNPHEKGKVGKIELPIELILAATTISKIKIKNFGPIKEGYLEDDGFMDIKKVTIFIGNQGSGKSTVAKVISTLIWLEKAINRGDVKKENIISSTFIKFFEYQRIHNYFKKETEIEFIGNKINIKYSRSLDLLNIEINNYGFNVPKIMYVPAERNFLSVIENPYEITLPPALKTFAGELRKGQLELKDELLQLPIGNIQYKYKKNNDTSYLIGEDYELDLLESSSGYQSLVPLYLVTKFLSDELQKGEHALREQLNVEQSIRRNKEIADVMFNGSLLENEKSNRVKEIDSKYLNTCLINIVEEPEQNLFPNSQHQILNTLLEFNNMSEGNKLIMTSHSPYLINYLTLSVKAFNVLKKIESSKKQELNRMLYKIVPLTSTVNPEEWIVYELDEENGTINRLDDYRGLPSDNNYLNNGMETSNELFANLLEIEDLCQ